jgi:hypothetical protein
MKHNEDFGDFLNCFPFPGVSRNASLKIIISVFVNKMVWLL